MIKVGLTGGIASGKSTVSDWLKARRYPLIDADRVAREVVAPGEPVLKQIADEFGRDMLLPDGGLNRKALGKQIFHDKDKRERLNGMLHPLIRERMMERVKRLGQAGAPVVFLDIPLLFEGPLACWVDRTLLVYVTKDIQLRRLMARNHLSREEAMARIGTQIPLDRKKKLADAVIDNSGSLRETENQLKELLKRWNLL
ncbi:dephospho-CoA kinase [Sporolactobacillus sp. THM7-7]|nr:dephospho-CoA kinase [Sporolactobacillus sp. THM7-7]